MDAISYESATRIFFDVIFSVLVVLWVVTRAKEKKKLFSSAAEKLGGEWNRVGGDCFLSFRDREGKAFTAKISDPPTLTITTETLSGLKFAVIVHMASLRISAEGTHHFLQRKFMLGPDLDGKANAYSQNPEMAKIFFGDPRRLNALKKLLDAGFTQVRGGKNYLYAVKPIDDQDQQHEKLLEYAQLICQLQ